MYKNGVLFVLSFQLDYIKAKTVLPSSPKIAALQWIFNYMLNCEEKTFYIYIPSAAVKLGACFELYMHLWL